MDEIAAHQRVIDGARQVVEGWKPNFELELAACACLIGIEKFLCSLGEHGLKLLARFIYSSKDSEIAKNLVKSIKIYQRRGTGIYLQMTAIYQLVLWKS